MNLTPPIPYSESDRIWSFSYFNLDISSFRDLAKLAASVAGTLISLVNLVDSYTKC